MNSKKISLILFSFLLLILSVSLVNAQEDFIATSVPSVELCPCSNQAYAVAIQNTGSVASSYSVLASGSAAEWVIFSPNRFILNPGEKGSLFVFVNSECNIEGDYDLEIFITTNNGLTKVIKQVLEFSQCYDYSLEQGKVIEEVDGSISFLRHEGPYALCKDEQKYIPILITNNEDFENRYKLFLDAPEWATLNVDNVKLDAKKSGIFLINFDATDVEDKEYNFKLSAISELGKVQRKTNVKVNVEKCYNLELELEKEKDDVCSSGEGTNYQFIVINLGTTRQSISLEVEGPDWAGFENAALQPQTRNRLTTILNQSNNKTESSEIKPELALSRKETFQLNPNQEKILSFKVIPLKDVSGNFEIIVHATPDNKTEFRASDTISIDVIEKSACYEAEISAKSSVNNHYSNDFFFVEVKNNGIKKAIYSVNLEGVSWVRVNPKIIELNPGQTGNLNININPSADVVQGTYGIKINLESNGEIYSKNIDIKLKKENEFVKKLKTNAKIYQYYIYLLILLFILLIVFRKQIKKRYNKFKVKQARLKALKVAREKRKEGIEKKKELEEKKQERPIKKKFKVSLSKIWIYVLVLIAIGIFFGHQNKLFNVKYFPIYIRNFLYSYLYYILIGVGIVIALFLLILLYNFIRKKGKIKREIKKVEKRKRKKGYRKLLKIILSVLAGVLIFVVAYFGLFENIKDFFVLYYIYIISGIVILVLIIFLIRFYKPLFKFLKQ